MNQFFSKNLNRCGRFARGIIGTISSGVAVYIHDEWPRIALALGVLGLFGIFQALRGWCIIRACGAKTPL